MEWLKINIIDNYILHLICLNVTSGDCYVNMQKIPHFLLKKIFSYYVMLNVDFGIFTNSGIYSVHWKSVKIGQVGECIITDCEC